MEPKETRPLAKSRAATYLTVAVSIVLSYTLLRGLNWQSGAQFHTVMETVATLLAFVVGAMALVRFHVKKSNGFLFIGVGFLGTAFLDGYHAVVTSEFLAAYLPSDLPSLIPWSWTASRLFLSVLLYLSLRDLVREQRIGEAGRIDERSVYLIGGVLTLASFLFFAFVPLPRAYYPEFDFHRPEELVPAAFFLAALVGYLRRREWRHDDFEHWLVLALIVGLAGQTVFMSFSIQLFDFAFDGAHVLKILSYGCVLTGLFFSMSTIFRRAEYFNSELQREIADRKLAEEGIQESEDRYRRLVELSPDGIMVHSDGKVVFANARLAEIFGVDSADSLVGTSAIDFVAPDERTRVMELREQAVAGESAGLTEGKFVRLDGSIIHVERVVAAITWDGEPSFLVMIRNISERKRTEEALNESERRYSGIAANIPGAIFQRVLHPDGRITFPYVSAGVRETHGVEADEVMADPAVLLRVLHPDDREAFHEILAASVKELEPLTFEVRNIKPNGEIVWIRTRQRPQRRTDGTVIWDGMFVDVTQQKRTEEALTKSEERYRKLLDLSPDAVYVHKLGRIVLINSAGLKVFGANSPNQIIGRNSLDLIHPEHRDLAFRRQRDAAKEGTATISMEQKRLRIDGTMFEAEVAAIAIDWEGERGGIVVVRDITEKKQAQELLRRAEELLRDAVESIPDGLVLFDREDRMLMWNRRFVDLYPELSRLMVPGTTAEELFRERIRSGAVGELDFPVDEYVRRRMEMRKIGGGTPFVHRHRDGRWFHTTERKTSEGGIVATTTDVTELKNSEADLWAAKEQAELANRAKSEFLANMSHEIRTPMNGVLGMASVLLESDLTPDQHKYAEIIKQSGTSLLSILNDILDLSKVEAGHVEIEVLDFDLRDLLDTIEALWQSRLESNGLDFSIEIESEVETVLRCDPTRIRQILVNLISNSAKFTESGGVRIRVSQRHRSAARFETRFEVTDTGIGIPPDAQPLIFSKFAQADSSTTRRYGGTGLGLAICEQLAELLDGEIGFDSIEGEGSTFWFTIRCAPGDPRAVKANIFAREIEDFRPEGPVRPLNILVAEDNVVNQAVIRALLDKAGHRFDIVGNGVEAVSAVMRTRYDLVLMDVQMPEMDGVTATRRIRSISGQTGRLPIIALTANAMKGDREMYLEAGMTDYVSKPIDPIDLIAAIARNGIAAESTDSHRSDGPVAGGPDDVAPVVDLDVLETMSEAVGEDVMPDLIEESVREMRAIVQLIVELGDGADLAALRRAAHDLKSSSGSFGAVRLQRLAQDLELASRESRASDARGLIEEIAPVGDQSFETLEAQARRDFARAVDRAVND